MLSNDCKRDSRLRPLCDLTTASRHQFGPVGQQTDAIVTTTLENVNVRTIAVLTQMHANDVAAHLNDPAHSE